VRILLLTQAFPPFNTSGAVRVGKLAHYLIERGHDVRVITASPLPYPRDLPTDISSDLVIRTRSLDPFVLIARLRGTRRNQSVTSAARSRPGTGHRARLLRWLGALLAIPEAQVGWYPSAVAAGRRLIREWRPDAIYASALPFTSHLVAARLARSSRVPWIAEFRDHFADNPYSNLPAWRDPIDRWIERRVVRSAAACVSVSGPMVETLRARHGKPGFVVLNGYDGEVRPNPTLSSAETPLRILYTGVIYPGRRDPSTLFAAIASLGPLAKEVEVMFYGQDLRGVVDLARRYHVSEQVHVLGTIAHSDSLAQQQAADVLLLLLWNDPREVGVYTGKLFEYIGAGRPILAVGSQNGVAAQLIRERGLGVVATDSSAIASALRGWLEEKRSAGRVAGPPEDAKTGLSRQEQFAVVDDLLHQIVDGEHVGRLPRRPQPSNPREPELSQP